MRMLVPLLCVILLARCKVDADFSGSMETQILPAEQYQREIVAIDRLVFQPKPLGDDGVAALDRELEGLGTRVGALKPDSKFLKLESLELRHLASRAKGLSASGTGAALQNDWMRIRNNLFDDRAWFARSANDLEYAATAMQTATTATVATTAAEPAPRRIEPRWALLGRWQVAEMSVNGQPRTDAEITESMWTFEPPHLVVRAGDGKIKAYSFADDGQYIELKSTFGENGFVKYKLTNEGLRLAFYDGLKRKPLSFEATADDPPLIVVRLVPIE
jgi:hypothetical protein